METLKQMAARMCGRYVGCAGCPVDGDGTGLDCIASVLENVPTLEEQIDALRKWAADNPPKTYKDDFFERMPMARRNSDGYPCMYVWEVYDMPEGRTRGFDRFEEWDSPLGTFGEVSSDGTD